MRRDRDRPEGYPFRRVLRDQIFDSGELERGEVELEEVPPADEPTEEPSEPCGWQDKEMPGEVRERLRNYREFLQQWKRDHPDEDAPEGDPEEGE